MHSEPVLEAMVPPVPKGRTAVPALLRGLAILVLLRDRTGEVLAKQRMLLGSVSLS